MSASPGDGVPFEKVLQDENEVIQSQRRNRGYVPEEGDNRRQYGLAFSGGGIRSASFALGVLQCLARRDQLKKFDYLSTVSGGGYIGASLTWFHFLNRGARNYSFPFGAKNFVRRDSDAGAEEAPDNTAFIRNQGEYLSPAKELTKISLIGVLLRNMLITFGVYFLLVLGATILARHYEPLFASRVNPYLPGFLHGSFSLAFATGAVFLLLSVLYGFSSWFFPYFLPSSDWQYRWRVLSQRWLGWVLAWTVGLAIIGSIAPLYECLQNWPITSVSVFATTGFSGLLFELLKQQRPRLALLWPKLSNLILVVGAFAMIYALLFGAYVISRHLDATADERSLAYLLIVASLTVGIFVNTNLMGLGRMYRDRLMEAFMPNPESVDQRRWGPATDADTAFMKDVCTEKDFGPYQLVNTNAVLTSTNSAEYRGRGGDNFIIAPRYCGGDALGWHRTSEFIGGTMSLATAVAISGAAINPNTACGGRGPTRNRLASFLLALFNVRLGYWVRNPNARPVLRGIVKRLWPNFFYPGLRQGLLGTGHGVHAGYVELTDGGHFENTGIYELIRRGVDVIVLSLASADPGYGFDDLADVVERVRVDFGVYIQFPNQLQEAIPCEDGVGGNLTSLRFAKQAYAVGYIHYPSNGQFRQERDGKLIVLKSALMSSLPVDVLRYAAQNADFPNQTTADQYFDERQFEAYREAGYASCHGMLKTGTLGE